MKKIDIIMDNILKWTLIVITVGFIFGVVYFNV